MGRASAATNVDALQLQDQGTAPAQPASGYLKIYCDNDQFKWIDDSGNEINPITGISDASCIRNIRLPLTTGSGTSNLELWNGFNSINFDADGETAYVFFPVPEEWDEASDMTFVAKVGNEIAEDDGDDISYTALIRAYGDGEAASDAGQSVAMTLNLTGGDEAINFVNEITGTIDYDHGTYPLAAGDVVCIEVTVNLAGGGECTGPLHIIGWWIEFTADSLGSAVP